MFFRGSTRGVCRLSQVEEREQVQLSVKCGPGLNFMWNLRGPDVATVVEHVHQLLAFAPSVNGALGQLQALERLGEQFEMSTVTSTSPVQVAPTVSPAAAPLSPANVGDDQVPNNAHLYPSERCPNNSAAWHNYRSGMGSNGRPYEGIMCTNKPQCATRWLN
jgi:hypothetical protein